MNGQPVMIKNVLKIENSMEIGCVFAMYNLETIGMLHLTHGRKFLKKTKTFLNEQRYNNRFCGEF